MLRDELDLGDVVRRHRQEPPQPAQINLLTIRFGQHVRHFRVETVQPRRHDVGAVRVEQRNAKAFLLQDVRDRLRQRTGDYRFGRPNYPLLEENEEEQAIAFEIDLTHPVPGLKELVLPW